MRPQHVGRFLLEESGARYSWDEVILASLAKIEGTEDEAED
ncbi:hypothetical protein ACQ859_25775 [Roseateles chitinivorans]